MFRIRANPIDRYCPKRVVYRIYDHMFGYMTLWITRWSLVRAADSSVLTCPGSRQRATGHAVARLPRLLKEDGGSLIVAAQNAWSQMDKAMRSISVRIPYQD
jgi:hypothetical protein